MHSIRAIFAAALFFLLLHPGCVAGDSQSDGALEDEAPDSLVPLDRGLGDSCGADWGSCAAGLYCVYFSNVSRNGTCQASGGHGATCGVGYAPCRAGLYCSFFSNVSTTGTCKAYGS